MPQVQPDAPPEDDSGVLGERQSAASVPKAVLETLTVAVPLLSHVHSRVLHGSTLELSFVLAVKARLRLLAKRRKTVVASTPTRTLEAGKRRLLLHLNIHKWPTKLELRSHPLAPLPTVAPSKSNETSVVSTSLRGFPPALSLGGSDELP